MNEKIGIRRTAGDLGFEVVNNSTGDLIPNSRGDTLFVTYQEAMAVRHHEIARIGITNQSTGHGC